MVTPSAVAGVAVVALLMVLTPGPNMIYLSRYLTARPVWLRVQRYLAGTVLGGMAVNLAVEKP